MLEGEGGDMRFGFRFTKVSFLLAIVVCALILPADFHAQGTSNLSGRVLDQQGAVLPGVGLTLRGQDTGLFRESISNENGTFVFTAMVPGVYQLEAELPGFKKYQQSSMRLEVGKTVTVNVVLEVGQVTEEVQVISEAPLVDTTSKEIGGHLENREIVDLPSINRNFTGYLSLLPGAVPNFNSGFGADGVVVGGQSGNNVAYSLDGSANNDSQRGGASGAQARVPIEAIQEFQLLVGQFDAEFGGSGGVVNAVSKQGTNAFHGSGFGFFKDSKFTAMDYFAKKNNLAKPQTSEQQFGGTLGGPVVQGKAHFFGSLERVVLNRGVTIFIPARPEFNSAETQKARVWNIFGRFDHQINSKHTWGFRWLAEWSPQNPLLNPSRTIPAQEQEKDLDQTYVGTFTSVLSPTTLNTFRVAVTSEDVFNGSPSFFANGGKQELLKPTLEFQTFRDQQSPRVTRAVDHTYLVNDTFSFYVPDFGGDHNFKAGVEASYTSNRQFEGGSLNGSFSFSGNGPFNAADPRTWPDLFTVRVPGPRDFLAKLSYGSAYFQDKWKISPNFTISAGLRYDVEVVPVNESNNPSFSSPADYPVDKNNVAPRVGFSYGLNNGRSVIRGGWGLFFQRTTFGDVSPYSTTGVFSDSFTVSFPTSGRDPGPSAGRLPTEPTLLTFPDVNRALLNQMFPAGAVQKNTGAVNLDNPDRKTPYSHQLSFGFQQQVGSSLAIGADYVSTLSRDHIVRKDMNLGLRINTTRTGRVDRPNPNFVSSVLTPFNVGEMSYHALQVQVEKRFSDFYSFRTSYTLSRNRGNVSGANSTSNFQLIDDLRLNLNEGPLNGDRRHNLSTSSTFEVPRTGGLRLSAVSRFLTGSPISIIDSTTDPDRNGNLNDPLPAGTYTGVGADAFTFENKGGRNGAYGPSYFQFDSRVSYKFRVGEGKSLEVLSEVLNLTNHTSFENPSGDRRVSDFLVPTAILNDGPTRTLQLGVRFAF